MNYSIGHDPGRGWYVLKGGRNAAAALSSRDKAIALVVGLARAGDRLFDIEDDGYRVEISKELRRHGHLHALTDPITTPTHAQYWRDLAARYRIKHSS